MFLLHTELRPIYFLFFHIYIQPFFFLRKSEEHKCGSVHLIILEDKADYQFAKRLPAQCYKLPFITRISAFPQRLIATVYMIEDAEYA